jgi:hypothetical protein
MMLALGFELVTNCPLLVNAAFLSVICLLFCIIQISAWTTYRKLIVSKVLILVLGLLTTYVFIATSVLIVEDITKGRMFLFPYTQVHVAIYISLFVVLFTVLRPTQ